jgi:serine/threonine-protein kinase SRPK3
MGADYDASADIWSLACTIFELITGDYLFEPKETKYYSRDEDHIALIMELLGPVPKSMIQNSNYGPEMFDSHGHLCSIRKLNAWGLQDVLEERYSMPHDEARCLASFLLPMLSIDPKKRASAAQMLKHPWLSSQTVCSKSKFSHSSSE